MFVASLLFYYQLPILISIIMQYNNNYFIIMNFIRFHISIGI